MKRVWLTSAMILWLLLAWCSLTSKEEVKDTNDQDILIEEFTGLSSEEITWALAEELSWDIEGKDINLDLEKKVDQIIEKHQLESWTNASWLTEKDVDFINSVISEITDSLSWEEETSK